MPTNIPELEALMMRAPLGEWSRKRRFSYLPMRADKWHDDALVDYLVMLHKSLPSLLQELKAGRALAEAVEKMGTMADGYADDLRGHTVSYEEWLFQRNVALQIYKKAIE